MPSADGTALAPLLARLATRPRTAIAAHERPDGDAIGAAVAMRRILSAAGIPARLVGLGPIPPRYGWLLEGEALDPGEPGWSRDTDLLIALDCGAYDRLGPFVREAEGRLAVANIDHHDSNARFGDFSWVDPAASSTGEMVWRFAKAGGLALPPEAAPALWVAIATDTGQFSYSNTGPLALRIGAELLEAGVQPREIHQRLWQSHTLPELRLMQRALASLELREAGRVACVRLSREDFAEFGCGPENAQEIVNLPRGLAGVEAGFFFYELPHEDLTKASIRTRPPLNANELCRLFGGGGHQRAAGCSLPGRLPAVMERVLSAAHDLWFPGRA